MEFDKVKQIPYEVILGYRVYQGNLQTCVGAIIDWMIEESSPSWLACLNPHSYSVSLGDPEFSDALHQADWLIPDGVGVVMASGVLKGNIRQRVTGSDVFHELNKRMNEMGGFRVFFLGADAECLSKIRERMAIDYPNVCFAGSYSPPFKKNYNLIEIGEMLDAINQARPDVLWVGISAPKQEKWIQQNLTKLDIRFAAAIGAVFDFYAGSVKRSHPVFQRLGLEWLPRLIQEPRRLWRRMFISAPLFIWHVIRERNDKRRFLF